MYRQTCPSYAPPYLRSSRPLSASAVEFSPSSRNPNSNRLLQPPRTVLHPPVPVPVVTFSILDINGVGVRFDGGGGINFDAYEDIPIEMIGLDVPPLAGTFAEIDLGVVPKRGPVRLCEAYVGPEARDTDIARRTGPHGLHPDRVRASSASPIVSSILRNRLPSSQHGAYLEARPVVLIMSPTRKLASQIHVEAKKFAFQRGVKVVVAYGGASMYYQVHSYKFFGESFH